MGLVLHPGVYSDVDQIVAYYADAASLRIAADFYAELRRCLELASQRPTSFPIRKNDRRRVNLPRFPYHFLFRITGETVRILVLEARQPLAAAAL